MERKKVISLMLSIGDYSQMFNRIIELARQHTSSYICVANVHMCMIAKQDKGFAESVNQADIVTPDGMPLVSALRVLHGIRQDRVAGMDLMPDLLETCEREGLSVFFYGATEETLAQLRKNVKLKYPALKIAGQLSPPFRDLSEAEESLLIKEVNAVNPNLVFVALGCPKQEKWMARNKSRISAPLIGVGGAFPVVAGRQSRAPDWMRNNSLEWLYRFGQEPGRLWKRYLNTNSMFLYYLLRELLLKRSEKA